ncbi:MAG TPA: LPS export ABC transporter periplasmic protein LptC [Desulfocapsa sulfexigens]|nr:LPS export ABC transporter periplasmic protein LptC [Desulfocapsa sulfexigens]
MITRRSLVWLIPLGLFLTFPLWRPPVATFLSPRGGYDPSLAKRKLDAHNFNMDQVIISQSKEGKKTLEVRAKKAFTGKSVDEFHLEEVDAVIFGKNDEKTYVTARRGIFNKLTNILTLIDEVVVVKPKDKSELYSDLLTYNNNTGMAYSPGKTRIIGDGFEIRGRNLHVNTLTKAYDLDGRVRCKLTGFAKP